MRDGLDPSCSCVADYRGDMYTNKAAMPPSVLPFFFLNTHMACTHNFLGQFGTVKWLNPSEWYPFPPLATSVFKILSISWFPIGVEKRSSFSSVYPFGRNALVTSSGFCLRFLRIVPVRWVLRVNKYFANGTDVYQLSVKRCHPWLTRFFINRATTSCSFLYLEFTSMRFDKHSRNFDQGVQHFEKCAAVNVLSCTKPFIRTEPKWWTIWRRIGVLKNVFIG